MRDPGPDPEPDVAELRLQLRRHPADRYPVQHATAAFHLGSLHLQRDRVPAALELLDMAHAGFGRAGLRLEQAKAELMLGVALRAAGRPADAREALSGAMGTFAELGQDAEQAAAAYNLGLVAGAEGDGEAARDALTRARELFLEARHVAQAGSATRELATSLLTAGEAGAAVPLLVEALELSSRGGDGSGAGGAANVLGLAHLAMEDPTSAVTAFTEAVVLHPRSVRPAEHAMAKANLALALQRAGDLPRARLAALQALATPGADGPVVEQGRSLLAQLPRTGGVLFAVLDAEPPDRWQSVVRDEVLRWIDSAPAVQRREAGDWVQGVLARPGAAPALGEALLGVLLELPPPDYAAVVALVVRAAGRCEEPEAERFRAFTRSSMARFALPQLQRMAGTFDQAATDAGEPARWS